MTNENTTESGPNSLEELTDEQTTNDTYAVLLEVPESEYAHLGAAISIIEEALYQSDEFRNTMPEYTHAERVERDD